MIVASLALLSSCASVMPANTPNIPLLEEKGDARLSANFVKGEIGNGANAQVAFSPADKFYLGASGSYVSYGDGLKSSMLEMSAGTYRRIGRKWKYDLSGGGGIGSNNTWGEYGNKRLFIQSAFGYTKDRFELALGGKLNHTIFNVKGADKNNPDFADFNIQSFDPFIALRFGGPNVKFQLLATYTYFLGTEEIVIPEKTISLGMHFNIGKKKFHL